MMQSRLLIFLLLVGILLAPACTTTELVPTAEPPSAEVAEVPEPSEPAAGGILREILNFDCDVEARWANGVDLVIFMHPDASPAAITALSDDLTNSPSVESHTFLDKAEAYVEFLGIFRDSSPIRDSVEPEDVPTSFRVALRESARSDAADLAAKYLTLPDVFDVVERPKICQPGYQESLGLCDESDVPDEAFVFLEPSAMPTEVDRIAQSLGESGLFTDIVFIDQEQAYGSLERMLQDEELASFIEPSDVPAEFRLKVQSTADTQAFFDALREDVAVFAVVDGRGFCDVPD